MRAGIPFSTTRLGPFVQIDGMSLFDKVLLHEMAHTWAGDQCDDVSPKNLSRTAMANFLTRSQIRPGETRGSPHTDGTHVRGLQLEVTRGETMLLQETLVSEA